MTRGARRRRRGTASLPPLDRVRRFFRSWEALISLSVVIVAVVLAAGIFRWSISLPFGLGTLGKTPKPEPPDVWGNITIPIGESAKLLYIGDASPEQQVGVSETRRAVEQALRERGEIQGMQVELTVLEDGCDAADATAKAAERKENPHLIGVISQACPTSAVAAKPIFEEAKLPYMVLTVTAPSFTGPGTLASFRMRWNEKAQGREAARYARQELKAGRALVLYETGAEHESIASEFRSGFRSGGGNVLDSRGIAPGVAEASSAAAQAKDMNGDFVYFTGSGQTALDLLRALRETGFSGGFMVSEAVQRDPGYAAGGAALEGTYASVLQTERGERYASWKEEHEREYGPVGEFSAEAYDATTLLLRGLELAAKKTENEVEFGRQRTISLMRGIAPEGVSGRLGFDANGDRVSIGKPILRYENGAWEEVKIAPPPAPAPSAPAEPPAEEGEGRTEGEVLPGAVAP